MPDKPQDPPGPNRLPDGFFDPHSQFAQRFRQLRIAAGMSQRQVAEAMAAPGFAMHQSTIADIEAGRRPVSISEAYYLVVVTGGDVREDIISAWPLGQSTLSLEDQIQALRERYGQNVKVRGRLAEEMRRLATEAAADEARIDMLERMLGRLGEAGHQESGDSVILKASKATPRTITAQAKEIDNEL